MYKAAYEAALYATPITPYSNIRPYIPGYLNPPSLPSEGKIISTAVSIYPDIIYQYKLLIWVMWGISIISSLLPLSRRIRNTVISASSIFGGSPIYYLWIGYIPLVIALVGQVISYYVMAVATSTYFYGSVDFDSMNRTVMPVLLIGMGLGLWFYVLSVSLGRLELGSMFILLASLVIDKVVASPQTLLYASIGTIVGGIVLNHLVLSRRWFKL